MIEKIISGGQTGADRAALDWAIEHGIPHGGWCPKDRMLNVAGPRGSEPEVAASVKEVLNKKGFDRI